MIGDRVTKEGGKPGGEVGEFIWGEVAEATEKKLFKGADQGKVESGHDSTEGDLVAESVLVGIEGFGAEAVEGDEVAVWRSIDIGEGLVVSLDGFAGTTEAKVELREEGWRSGCRAGRRRGRRRNVWSRWRGWG